METVQLQCGSCQKLMKIGVQHLGSRVQCPYCRTIVQTEAPAAPAPAAKTASWLEKIAARSEEPQQESIFADHDASDSVLGETPAPRVEMPAPEPVSPAVTETPPSAPEEPSSDAQLPKFQPKPIYDKGILSISLLIFLIPYAILTTGIIIYLLLSGPAPRSDPFEYLRDPVKKDGPKRVQHSHNEKLASYLRTTLGKPIQAGDLLVTFTKVRLTADGDLQLVLRAKNTSTNTAFEPINDFFVKLDHGRKDSKPYTFLESRSKDGLDHLYNMYLAYFKDANATQEQASGKLHPNEETTIVLTTDFPYRDKYISRILQSKDEYTWRVQVRRGFVRVDGKDVPATMVIGLDFASADIERVKS